MNRFELLRKVSRQLLTAAFMVGTLLSVGVGAQAVDPQVSDASQSGLQRQQPEDPVITQQRRDLAKKQNESRQQDIKKDTDKLLQLATELKQYVDKTNENILSLDVIKKAEEIEKLARTVKDKMKSQ